MRTVTETIELYTFTEASEDLKNKVLENYWYINIEHEWYDFTYEDAKEVGIIINGFDIDRGAYCDISFQLSELDTAQRILKNHGDSCDTYETAKNFVTKRSKISSHDYHALNSLDDNFKKEISEDYRTILSNEYEYLTSENAIIECLEANEYEFTIDGKIY